MNATFATQLKQLILIRGIPLIIVLLTSLVLRLALEPKNTEFVTVKPNQISLIARLLFNR
ncbi:MAG: hypothetical protein ACFE0J_10225 [Elainellaceae cyanobacterium]